MKKSRFTEPQILAILKQGESGVLVCTQKSGPVFELVPAPIMELRHGQESQA
jgi:hypothetical protein